MIDETTHDTKNPLGCCERCYRRELARRARYVPTCRYSQTASSGKIVVVHGRTVIAVVRKDALFGWHVEEGSSPVDEIRAIETFESTKSREVVGYVVDAYTRAWRRGFDPTTISYAEVPA